MDLTDRNPLTQQLVRLETEGVDLSADWMHFAKGKRSDIDKLQTVTGEAVQVIQALAARLDTQLQQEDRDAVRDRLSHAANIAAELLQSRLAVQALLDQIRSGDGDYYEYYRALAIKELAAKHQAQQLERLLTV